MTPDRASAVDALAGRFSACRSMRIWPRRIVWHSIVAVARRRRGTGTTGGSAPLRCCSCSCRRRRAAPCRRVTSTMHSLHLPWATHDVGTRTPACSAASNSVTPAGASMRVPVDGERDGMLQVALYQSASASSSRLHRLARPPAPRPRAPAPRSTATARGSRRRPAARAWRPADRCAP